MTDPTLPRPKALECCCCGNWSPGRQWWNRDTGYSICPDCAAEQATYETPERMTELYGTDGVHYNLKDTP